MKLELLNIRKTYGKGVALESINFLTENTRSLAIIGPSGGGKSTLLRIIAGLEFPDTGIVRLDGQEVIFEERSLIEYRRSIGMVFQSFNLFPHLTALKNITLPLEKVHGYTSGEAVQSAMLLLHRFQLAEHASKRPYELSGGQRQRVAIARALSVKPQVLLLDEPTSALDPEMTSEVLGMIEELKNEGRNMIIVTHELGFARAAAEEIIFLAQGRIIEQGPVRQIMDSPGKNLTREFLARVMKY
jgi:polar amino acid transport system ATP-binding protein